MQRNGGKCGDEQRPQQMRRALAEAAIGQIADADGAAIHQLARRRDVDVSYSAAKTLGTTNQGVAKVKMEIIPQLRRI